MRLLLGHFVGFVSVNGVEAFGLNELVDFRSCDGGENFLWKNERMKGQKARQMIIMVDEWSAHLHRRVRWFLS